MALAAALAVLVGLSLGALGGGGSILTVPILVYVLGVAESSVVGASLLVVGAASAVGVAVQARRGNVHWRTGLLFSAAGTAGAFGGGRLAGWFPPGALLMLFAAVMLVTGVAMLRRRGEDEACPTCKLSRSRILAIGAGVGFVTGLLGAGGGFLVVPALALFGGLEMRQAVGTSLLVITLNSLAGFAGHVGQTGLPWSLMLVMAAAAAAGVVGGAAVSARLPARALRRAFGLFVVGVGLYMGAREAVALGAAGLAALWPVWAGALGVLAAFFAVIRLGSLARHRGLPHQAR